MTAEQASERFAIPLGRLRLYEAQGLLDCRRRPDGSIDYDDGLTDILGIIHLLTGAGAEPEDLRGFLHRLMQRGITKEETVQYLRSQRAKLLDGIHEKQRSLDQLDYLICRASRAAALERTALDE